MLYVSTPPEDAAPEDRSDSKGEPVDRQPGDKVDDADLGPWFALLKVAVGDPINVSFRRRHDASVIGESVVVGSSDTP